MFDLRLGDCLVEMDKLILDGVKVDMVLTDPPYGTTPFKWDSIIPLDLMWERLNKLIKSNCSIVMTSSQPFTTKLISSNYEMFKYCWYWDKVNKSGFAHAKNMPLKHIEDVVVFSSGSINHKSVGLDNRMFYFPQGIKKLDKPLLNNNNFRGDNMAVFSRGTSQSSTYYQEYTNYPKQLLTIYNRTEKIGYHPTQKPVGLLEYLIKTYTEEGDTVLDFTMGSGSTGVACKNLNRKFIGIELDEKYFDIAKERIEGFVKGSI